MEYIKYQYSCTKQDNSSVGLTYSSGLVNVTLGPGRRPAEGGASVVLEVRHLTLVTPEVLLGLGAHPPHPLDPDEVVVPQTDHAAGAGPGGGQAQSAIVSCHQLRMRGDAWGWALVTGGRGVTGAVVGGGLQLDAAQTQPRVDTGARQHRVYKRESWIDGTMKFWGYILMR